MAQNVNFVFAKVDPLIFRRISSGKLRPYAIWKIRSYSITAIKDGLTFWQKLDFISRGQIFEKDLIPTDKKRSQWNRKFLFTANFILKF